MRFEFSHTERFESDLEIDDYGNVCIKAIKDTPYGYYDWYLIIRTNYGFSNIEWFGPFEIDSNRIDSGKFMYTRNYIECKEKTIYKIIDGFLSKTGGDSFQAFEHDEKEALELLSNAFNQLSKIRNDLIK